jgi:hypothetical protein
MTFTLKHCIELPNGDEKEYITSAEEVSYRTTGEELTLRGAVYYSDGEDKPTKKMDGSGKVYVMNESGKTVATYWLGPVVSEEV